MRRLLPLLLVLSVLAIGCKTSSGSSDPDDAGKLDTTFNDPYGFTVNAESSGGTIVYARLAVQGDGRIVAVGSTSPLGDNSRMLVARYTPDGRLDASFGTDGTVTYTSGADEPGIARAVALQDDGRIVVCGYSFTEDGGLVLVIRLNADGTLDTAFGTNGAVNLAVQEATPAIAAGMAVAVQSDGAIVVAGISLSPDVIGQGFVLRLTRNGSLDGDFAEDGIYTEDTGAWFSTVYGLALSADGAVTAAGVICETEDGQIKPMLLRLTPQGRLDTSFGDGGLAVWGDPAGADAQLLDLAVGDDRSLAAVGYILAQDDNNDMLALRFTPDGALDTSFADSGAFTFDEDKYDSLQGVTVLPSGSILATGEARNDDTGTLVLLKLTPGGALATNFGDKGVFAFQPGATQPAEGVGLAVQPGRGILACGSTAPDEQSPREGLLLRVHD